MKRRRAREREQWERLVAEHTKSGLSVRRFCERESLNTGRFYYWRQQIQDATFPSEDGNEPTEAFIDMGQVDSTGVSTPAAVNPWIVTLDFGDGLKLTLRRG
jgi:transposase-like protein